MNARGVPCSLSFVAVLGECGTREPVTTMFVRLRASNPTNVQHAGEPARHPAANTSSVSSCQGAQASFGRERRLRSVLIQKVGARDVSASERQEESTVSTPLGDKITTTEQAPNASVMDAAIDLLSSISRYEQGEGLTTSDLVLLGDTQIAEFKAGIRSLELSTLEEIAMIAQVEIDRRYFEREHDAEIAPRLPFAEVA